MMVKPCTKPLRAEVGATRASCKLCSTTQHQSYIPGPPSTRTYTTAFQQRSCTLVANTLHVRAALLAVQDNKGTMQQHVDNPGSDGEEEGAFLGEDSEGEVLEGEGMSGVSSSEDGEDGGEGGDPSTSGQHYEDASLQAFEGHEDAVLAVAWSPAQADLVATGGQDDKAFLWRVGQDAYEQTGGTLGTLELSGHTDSIVALGFNSSGTLLASGSMDASVRVWNTADGSLVRALEGPGDGVEWLQWHPKGDVVLAGCEDFTIWMWLAQTGHCMQVFSGHSGPVAAGSFTPDGKTVVSAGGEGDCSLRAWNPRTGECTATIQGHPFHTETLTCLAVHREGQIVMTGAQDGSLRVSNIATSRIISSPAGHEDSVEAVGFSATLPVAASAGVDGKLMIWDTSAGFTLRSQCQHPQGVTRMAWHPTQPVVVTACLDGVVRAWDLRTGVCLRELGGHQAAVQDVCLSPDGRMVLSGSDDQTARVFMLAP